MGTSAYSSTDTGYRGVGALTYQWQRSAADSDASYADLSGATTASHGDMDAPPDGSGRWYRCTVSASGATSQTSVADRGFLSGGQMNMRLRGSNTLRGPIRIK